MRSRCTAQDRWQENLALVIKIALSDDVDTQDTYKEVNDSVYQSQDIIKFNVKMNRYYAIFLIIFFAACVDRIDFATPKADVQIVLEGMISDELGPYTIKMYRSRPLGTDLDRLVPVRFAKITLLDDSGNAEPYKEVSDGVYQTTGLIRGEVGKNYHISLVTSEGKIYESVPEKIFPVGEVEKIYSEFEARTVLQEGKEVPQNRFNIFMDSKGVPGSGSLVRWKSTGTYKVETFPQLRTRRVEGGVVPDPYPCSGYIVREGRLVKDKDCECCICWVNEMENVPQVSDDQFIIGSGFKHAKVGEVLINGRTFYEKYRVEIAQLSLTQRTFTYWKLIKAQKQGAGSLFQPPSAKIYGNLKGINTAEEMIGLFWATAIKKKSIFINRQDVPYLIARIDTLKAPCKFFTNSTNEQPSFWK